MKKILLTKNNYKKFISKDKKEICIEKNMILTPGAKDEIKRSNINIFYENEVKDQKIENNSSDKKDLTATIKDMLKKDFDISDEKKLTKVCNLVLNKINKK